MFVAELRGVRLRVLSDQTGTEHVEKAGSSPELRCTHHLEELGGLPRDILFMGKLERQSMSFRVAHKSAHLLLPPNPECLDSIKPSISLVLGPEII